MRDLRIKTGQPCVRKFIRPCTCCRVLNIRRLGNSHGEKHESPASVQRIFISRRRVSQEFPCSIRTLYLPTVSFYCFQESAWALQIDKLLSAWKRKMVPPPGQSNTFIGGGRVPQSSRTSEPSCCIELLRRGGPVIDGPLMSCTSMPQSRRLYLHIGNYSR